MDIDKIIFVISGLIQICIFNMIYQLSAKQCTYKVRIILVDCIYMIMLAVMYIKRVDLLLISGLLLAIIFLGSYAYEYTGIERLLCIMTGFGIVIIAYVLTNSINVAGYYIGNQLILMDIFEMTVFFVMKLIGGIVDSSNRNNVYLLILIYFIGVANVLREIFMQSHNIGSIMVSFVILHLLAAGAVNSIMKLKNQSLQQKSLNEQVQYYKNELDVLDMYNANVRGLKHDLSNHLDVLKGLIEKGENNRASEYIYHLKMESDTSSAYVVTGNYEIDSILNSKINIMDKEGISYKYKVVIPDRLDITPVDLVVVIGNVMDNAIRAARESRSASDVKNMDNEIEIRLEYNRGVLMLAVENSCINDGKKHRYCSLTDGQAVPGFLSSTKQDKAMHGIGMRNIIAIVSKYEGYITIEKENGRFSEYIEICI